ncbi:MAG: cytochrome c [Acidobacteriota bacterium]|nr:cytochrome c [Acidobacteriota bacterium]
MQGSGIRQHPAGRSLGIKQLAAVCAAAAVSLLATGCRQDMHNQPKFIPQRGTDFFVDGRSVRPQVENTVARSQLRTDSYFWTGMQNGKEGDGLPFPVTMAVLERGQERYNIYCTPCHSRVGNGAGMIVQRGYAKAGNFHTQRLAAAPLGHFFNVITNGYGAMPEYSAQLTPEDRWAVAAYIRALQLSQAAKPGDVAGGEQSKPLSAIAESLGLPAGFAYDWGLPGTSTTGTPTGEQYVLPSTATGSLPSAGAMSTGPPNRTPITPMESRQQPPR